MSVFKVGDRIHIADGVYNTLDKLNKKVYANQFGTIIKVTDIDASWSCSQIHLDNTPINDSVWIRDIDLSIED